MPRVCLQFVIVVFPDHSHLLFFCLNYGMLGNYAYVCHLLVYCLDSYLSKHQIFKILYQKNSYLELIKCKKFTVDINM